MKLKLSRIRLIFLIGVLAMSHVFLGQACSSKRSSDPSTLLTEFSLLTEELGSGSVVIAGRTHGYRLLRLTYAPDSSVYVQWFPSSREGLNPVVVIAEPYAGISWTGEAIDQKWAGRPNASIGYWYDDEDGPNYQVGVSGQIRYVLTSPAQQASVGAVYLANDVSVLFIYGRFYAGKSIADSFLDMSAGLEFLGQAQGVDLERIAIYGASWGGFEALFAMANARSNLRPALGAMFFPLSDAHDWANYQNIFIPNNVTDPLVSQRYNQLFDPHLRRIYSSTGGPPTQPGVDYSGFRVGTLVDRITNPVLIFHDEWDVSVPAELTRNLIDANPDVFRGFWFPHSTSINYDSFDIEHFQSSEGFTFDSALPFVYAFFLTRLLPSRPITIFYNQNATNTFFTYIRNQQVNGKDISWLTDRLIDLCDSRITLEDVQGSGTTTGSSYISFVLNTLWGTNTTPTNICNYLSENGIPN